MIGAIVLTVDDEPDEALSYWEVTRRAGCIPTLLTMCYDQVLEEPLEPHECLIDFLAVSAEARGKGVGSALIRWAEQAATEILKRRVPEAVADHGVLMSLWVAADNTPATRLYNKETYKVVRRTDESLHACVSSCILRKFLGHPVWWKMHKALPVASPLNTPEMAPKQAMVGIISNTVELKASPAKVTFVEVSSSTSSSRTSTQTSISLRSSPTAAGGLGSTTTNGASNTVKGGNSASNEDNTKMPRGGQEESIYNRVVDIETDEEDGPPEKTYCSPVCELVGICEDDSPEKIEKQNHVTPAKLVVKV